MRDFEVHGGRIALYPPDILESGESPVFPYAAGIVWVNNVFEDLDIEVFPTYDVSTTNPDLDFAFEARNNLFRHGSLILFPSRSASGNWTLTDNLFDAVKADYEMEIPSGMRIDNDFNAYWRTTHLLINNDDGGTDAVNDKELSAAPPYQAGPYSDYYLPTGTLVYHAGSRTVAVAGLFHYTTCVDQTKEGDETPSGHNVSIGLHYVAAGTDGKPKDSETGGGDGIPDYIEDANGNGQWDSATETRVDSAQTVPGFADAANPIYDDVDLDGDGMVGRLENASNRLPLVADSRLSELTGVTTGQEPQIVAFKVPVPYHRTDGDGGLDLIVDDESATLQECAQATDGSGDCVITWNATYEAPGQHLLHVEFTSGTLEVNATEDRAIGAPVPYYSPTVAQFDETYAQYDDSLGATLYAKLPQQSATYTIRLLSPSGQLIKTLPDTPDHVGFVDAGEINESWNLTDSNGATYAGDAVTAAYDVTLPGQPTRTATQALNRGARVVPDGMFDVAFFLLSDSFKTHPEDSLEWNVILYNVVNPLMVAMNAFTPLYDSYWNLSSDGYNPGHLDSMATVRDRFLPSLGEPQTRNLYLSGHGHRLYMREEGLYPPVAALPASDVASTLVNSWSVFGGIKARHPYRFVFLDGCSTWSGAWRHAFGIPGSITAARLNSGAASPQAFVGWERNRMKYYDYPDPTRRPDLQQAVTRFFVMWMQGQPLDECIRGACTYGSYVQDNLFMYTPFPVPSNKEHFWDGVNPPLCCPNGPLVSPLKVAGCRGIEREGYNPNREGAFTYK